MFQYGNTYQISIQPTLRPLQPLLLLLTDQSKTSARSRRSRRRRRRQRQRRRTLPLWRESDRWFLTRHPSTAIRTAMPSLSPTHGLEAFNGLHLLWRGHPTTTVDLRYDASYASPPTSRCGRRIFRADTSLTRTCRHMSATPSQCDHPLVDHRHNHPLPPNTKTNKNHDRFPSAAQTHITPFRLVRPTF